MKKSSLKNPDDYIQPLYINGLHGRVLRMPSVNSKNREILLVYGQHASLERIFGLADELNKYGSITIPDLPGFGGMEAFYKVKDKPTLDNLADYLASFVKLRYNRKRLTVVGMSYGFVILTRMLQRHPDLVKKVDLLISVVGFVHKDDFHINKSARRLIKTGGWVLSLKMPAWITKTFLLRPVFIRTVYRMVAKRHAKLHDADAYERDRRINFEINLWRVNDIRTYMYTCRRMFTLDLCHTLVNLPVYHVAVEPDRYFDNHVVEQHMSIIFDSFTLVRSSMKGHAPTMLLTSKDAAPLIPRKLKRLLSAKQQV